ncbi:HDIG domain-containing protein [Amphibacillus sp. MSJ-3]|uniref:HD family phosphohydrolase n=1 Tax=Amphibacillus sp. MSJ-3 TaxID=2841505 RepID=UPI001C0F0E7B|nr:HDIG domain-containing metalloprotein [Amphibacillus sp. MSJ-3]MBU5595167.1 HDIG domain-containing protein [Amphibacillus sp. MSJ-3]
MKIKFEQYKKVNKPIQVIITLMLIGLAVFLTTLSNVYTETYEFERYSVANETIQSPISIEDTKETERRQREVLQAVEDRYLISTDVTSERIDYIDELFDVIESVNQPSSTSLDQDEDEKLNKNEKSTNEKNKADKLIELKQLISQEITEHISDEDLQILISANNSDRQVAHELLTTTLYEIFNEGIQHDQIEDAQIQLSQRLQYSSLSDELKEALLSVGEFALVENSFFSIEETMEAESQAINNVEPAMIRAGEVIVREGQTITNEIYDKLTLVGLLNSDRNIFPILGLIILIILLLSLLSYSLFTYLDEEYLEFKHLSALTIIFILTISIMKFISLFSTDINRLYLLMPIAASSILIKILFRERLAMVFAIVFSVIGTIIFNEQIPGSLNLEAGIYFLSAQISSIAALITIKDRVAILKTASVTGIVNILVILGFVFLSYDSYQLSEIILFGAYGFISALLSGIVAIGTLPFFESILQLLSDTKLLALANPNHPLLRKILTDAPGTYHHSVMVANLSEAACEAIGGNGLLARVSAYYHDLGKTLRPHYFIENQMGMKNPHDFLQPSESAEIIIAHPYDGAKMLKDHNLPKEIIDIAKEHHGTSLLKYFYYKEKEINKEINESSFRYPGPLPQTKESAIVSICDSVEAAVRSMDQPTKTKIDQLIEQIIQGRLQDGQFNDCSLTFKELTKIKQTISETLNGIYHSRIHYPKESEEAR